MELRKATSPLPVFFCSSPFMSPGSPHLTGIYPKCCLHRFTNITCTFAPNSPEGWLPALAHSSDLTKPSSGFQGWGLRHSTHHHIRDLAASQEKPDIFEKQKLFAQIHPEQKGRNQYSSIKWWEMLSVAPALYRPILCKQLEDSGNWPCPTLVMMSSRCRLLWRGS